MKLLEWYLEILICASWVKIKLSKCPVHLLTWTHLLCSLQLHLQKLISFITKQKYKSNKYPPMKNDFTSRSSAIRHCSNNNLN